MGMHTSEHVLPLSVEDTRPHLQFLPHKIISHRQCLRLRRSRLNRLLLRRCRRRLLSTLSLSLRLSLCLCLCLSLCLRPHSSFLLFARELPYHIHVFLVGHSHSSGIFAEVLLDGGDLLLCWLRARLDLEVLWWRSGVFLPWCCHVDYFLEFLNCCGGRRREEWKEGVWCSERSGQ